MHRDRIALLLFPVALALGAAVSCTTSDPVNPTTGTAGTSGGSAGTSASAGTSGGGAGTTASAGTSGGGAGTTAAAGTSGGGAGTTAGSSGGGAGTTAAAGTSGGGAGTTAGGAGTTGTPDAGAAISFATDIYPFIMTQCMPCHTKATGQDGGPLDMSSATNAYKSLLGTATPVTGAPAKTDVSCKLLDAKKLRVEPGNPTNSYLYIKVSNTDTTLMAMSCGPAMPETKSGLTLTSDQKQKIHDWIMGGAKP